MFSRAISVGVVMGSAVIGGGGAASAASTDPIFNLMFAEAGNTGLDDIVFLTYPTFGDLVGGTNGTQSNSDIAVSLSYDATGLAAVMSPTEVVPAPATLPLALSGFSALLFLGRRRRTA